VEPVDECAGAQGVIDGGRDDSGARVVNLVGEIDLANADALGEKLDQLIGDGAERLVVDLSALDFMDSSGIAMLLRTAGRVDSMTVRNPTDVVRRIIECTGLADTLRIEP
jgi:anti-anti-sigma factor